MSDIKEMEQPTIDEKNNEIYLKFVKRFWELDDESMEFIKNRLVTKDFDPEYARLLKDSTDQRIRWDINFSEPSMQNHYSESDEAYKMFKRKFGNILNHLNNGGISIAYAEFMSNKVLYKKNETKLKKVFEIAYAENNAAFKTDSGSTATPEVISNYIVKSFEHIGTFKKPCKKLQLVLSFNLVDWLLASTGGGISSCLNLEGGHKFWSGLPMMSGDYNRAILYISDGSKKTYEGMTVDNASTRTWVILTEKNSKSIIRWYTSDILPIESIRNITSDSSWVRGMDSNGKNPIIPIKLKSGIISSIYMDEGCWQKNGDKENFIHTLESKGCFQFFSDSLIPLKSNFDFVRPWQNGNDWKISEFKKYGISVNDHVPVAVCSKCGDKRSFVRKSSISTIICHRCFSKEYFVCGRCENYFELSKKHFSGVAIKSTTKFTTKICGDCLSEIKTCECCKTPIVDGAMKTLEGTYVCLPCLDDKNNGYKRCEICGKTSKTKVKRVYDSNKKTIIELCDEHMVSEKSDIEKNEGTFIPYIRKPFSKLQKCKKCSTLLPKEAMFYEVCLSCKEDSSDLI